MNISIEKFTLIVVSFFLVIFASAALYFYHQQQNNTAAVVLKSLNSQISEVNYIVSKALMSNKDKVETQRPLLDRVAVNNEFTKLILVHDGYKVLLSTDPFYKKILPTRKLNSSHTDEYTQLMSMEAIESPLRFYKKGKLVNYHLVFVLDKEEIDRFFYYNDVEFFTFFVMLPLFSMILIWLIGKRYIVKPLEILRQYAYYHEVIPKAFKIQELETIRYSMVETFNRLENEKKELYMTARTDTLSGLANRNALKEYMNRLIDVSKRDDKEFAMLFLDLDHFKSVNDSLGHNVGDELLKKIAGIIDEALRPTDFVARVGGDEFVVILQDYKSMHDLITIVERIQKVLSSAIVVQTNPMTISSSIGIAFYPKDGSDIVSLMKNSDIAMYEAKKSGRSQYHFFTEELNQRVQDAIKLEKEMKEALMNKEYELYYQPKVEIESDQIIGVEALIRWISPRKGMISPDNFIPLAEEDGFIVELGTWILESAIMQQVAWKKKGISLITSINLSSKQLLEDNFLTKFINLMNKHQADPKYIDIEITEYMFYENNEKNKQVLFDLHDFGVSISLDDFGTGYSSLAYLKDFPIDYLKIDKSFIDDYANDRGRIFIDTIVKMGQTLKIKVIAEGVETLEQASYLQSIQCDQYQGYYMSRPLSVKDFEKFYFEKE